MRSLWQFMQPFPTSTLQNSATQRTKLFLQIFPVFSSLHDFRLAAHSPVCNMHNSTQRVVWVQSSYWCMPSSGAMATCSLPHTAGRWNKNIPRHELYFRSRISLPHTTHQGGVAAHAHDDTHLHHVPRFSQRVQICIICCCLQWKVWNEAKKLRSGKLRKCALQRKEEEKGNSTVCLILMALNGVLNRRLSGRKRELRRENVSLLRTFEVWLGKFISNWEFLFGSSRKKFWRIVVEKFNAF